MDGLLDTVRHTPFVHTNFGCMHVFLCCCKIVSMKVKDEYETHSIATKVIFISALKVHVHVIEDIVLLIVLKRKLKDKLHA